jgi:hypothetical protein
MKRYWRSLFVPVLAAGAMLTTTPPAGAVDVDIEIILGITNDDKLLLGGPGSGSIPGNPDVVDVVPITGKHSGDDLVAIDLQPSTGELFALGSLGYVYLIDADGVATELSATPLNVAGATAYDIDFNPVVDRIRVVTDNDKNYRVNPNDGAVIVDTDITIAASDPNVGNPVFGGVAYTNNFDGATTTSLFAIDTNKDVLMTTSNPNSGVYTTVGALGVDVSGPIGFDISGSEGTNVAKVVATSGSTSSWYSLNLVTGALTLDGIFPNAGTAAVVVDDISVFALQFSIGDGYALAAADGGVFTYGSQGFYGSAGNIKLNSKVVDSVSTGGEGYWLAAADGGVFAYGDAGFYGSAGSIKLNKPVVGMDTTIDAGGYWLVASDGGVFAYGNAGFYGSAGNIKLNSPIVGMVSTPTGEGYWLVAADGGVFAYGDAQFHGSAGGIKLNSPIVSIVPYIYGDGYWLVAADGGVFAYGDAPFFGSAGGIKLNAPIVDGAFSYAGDGYWLAAADGGVFAFGPEFYGSAGNIKLNSPVVSIIGR